MSPPTNWVTPSVRDVILLEKFPGREPAPHYGLVVGVFKMILGEQHVRFLMVSPGTSAKPAYPLRTNFELRILPRDGGVGKETIFYFDHLVQIFEFPSEDILESNKPRIQPDQASSVIGTLNSSFDYIASIRRYYDHNMMNLYTGILDHHGIDLGDCINISPKKPMSFWI